MHTPSSAPVPAAHVSARAAPPGFAFVPVATRASAVLLDGPELPRLVTACAPSGYGKTVLLSQVHDAVGGRGQRCLWVSLDDRDNDLASLLELIDLAITASPMAQQGGLDHSPPPCPLRGPRHEEVLARLFANAEVRTVLLIDNLGECRDPALAAFLERLVFTAPASMHLLLSSRQAIPLDMVRAKLELGALELRSADLRFDRASTARLLRDANIELSNEADIDRILAQTEGWPAALRLLQMLMRTANHGSAEALDEVLARFNGDQHDIAEVLTRRVLIGFDPPLVTFMLEMALLREFSTELAVAATGQAQARGWMEALVARNVLIFPLDHDRRWYRFHTLLREFLLAEGRQSLTLERRQEVLSQAVAWHASTGRDDTALEIALEGGLAGGLEDAALALLDKLAPASAGDDGRSRQFMRQYERLADGGALPSLAAHSWYAWHLFNSMQLERAGRSLASLDQRVAASAQALDDELHRRLHFLRAHIDMFHHRVDEAGAAARAWLASDGPRPPGSETAATAVVAVAALHAGDSEAAVAPMARSRIEMGQAGNISSIWMMILQACLETTRARPDLADEWLDRARSSHQQLPDGTPELLLTIDFVQAHTKLDLGLADEARALALRALPSAGRQLMLPTAEQGLLACAALWAPDGSGAWSSEDLDRAARHYPPRVQTLVAAGRVRRLLELGYLAEAMGLARTAGLASDEHAAPAEAFASQGEWLAARIDVLHLQGRDSEAGALITAELKRATVHGRHRDRVELWLAMAQLHRAAGKPHKARRAMAQAITVAAPGRLLQPFLRRPLARRELLTGHTARDFGLTQPDERALVERLTEGLAPRAPAAGPEPLATEALKERELELLELLDQGLSNEQAAQRMRLSHTTVKWYLRNLYTKLDVRSRSAAVAKARALHLLPTPGWR